jgi:farnesol dehydrogenase
MRIFLTGGTGFLGGAILGELLRRGHEVTLLARSPRGAAALPPGARVAQGAIEAPETYRTALRGHDVLVHAAALVKMWARDRSAFDRVNIEGTENALRAAADAGVPRVVYVSSFMALGPSNGAPLVEDDPRRTPECHNDYERTKHLADRLARRYLEQGYPLTIVYPGVIYGPGSLTDGNLVARTLVRFLAGRMPLGLDIQSWSYAFVGDVVRGVAAIVATPPPSRRYILGGDNRTGEEFYRALAKVTGRRAPRFNLPAGAAALIGRAEYLLAEWFGREPRLLTHEVARVYTRSWTLDSARAARELGYTITPLEEGLARLVAWLRQEGHAR